METRGFGFNPQHIDIYSISWGPVDDGKVVDGPHKLTQKVILNGIRTGRGGLGSIYVVASGNGGGVYDSCACDGYASSIYTVSVGGASSVRIKSYD